MKKRCKKCGRFYSEKCNHKTTNISKEKLIELYHNKKMSLEQIAKELNVSSDIIYRKMKQYQISRRSRQEALSKFKKLGINRKILYDLYITKKMTQEEIGKSFNVSDMSISSWLKNFNIKARKASECNIGHKFSKESKEKMRMAKLGKHFHTEEFKRRHSERMMGEKNPFYGQKHTEEQKEKWSEERQGQNSGEGSPNWKGGISFEPYPPTFNEQLKRKIRKRDNYTCQECEYTEKQLGYNLCVHHIDYDKNNCSEDNLISLCVSCNSKANYGREEWTKHFKEMIN